MLNAFLLKHEVTAIMSTLAEMIMTEIFDAPRNFASLEPNPESRVSYRLTANSG